ncbi:hypothetical protein AAFF_G00224170 [Aldrovandia affinis]|uniref:Uncharacterized protein n=1 Tax=Aldrovandia affinis TaxID=143900 RepID=A0AAD7TAX3_9TELE|nr:hypothetical protein AAFF_G00224170 [Aldrovandia affinis]
MTDSCGCWTEPQTPNPPPPELSPITRRMPGMSTFIWDPILQTAVTPIPPGRRTLQAEETQGAKREEPLSDKRLVLLSFVSSPLKIEAVYQCEVKSTFMSHYLLESLIQSIYIQQRTGKNKGTVFPREPSGLDTAVLAVRSCSACWVLEW